MIHHKNELFFAEKSLNIRKFMHDVSTLFDVNELFSA